MPRFLAETLRDQEEIDRLARENRKLREEIERLRREIEEYKKRHPTTVGIKNGKAYFIMDEHPKKEKSNRNLGAQIGHKGHYRRMPHITERVTLKASEFSWPHMLLTPRQEGHTKEGDRGHTSHCAKCG